MTPVEPAERIVAQLTRSAASGLVNWAGNQRYSAASLLEPESLEELQDIVRSKGTLRVLGSRHSFNDIADTTGDLVSLARMPRIMDIDTEAATVTVDGGVRYGDLCPSLESAGFALHNLASLPHISVAGACATGTHGSGDRSGNLATAVRAMEVVTADGALLRLERGIDADFEGGVVSLGGLGVVTQLTLDVGPTFMVRQDLYEDLPLETAVEEFDEISASASSVSLFTEWRGPTIDQVWLKRRVEPGEGFEPPPAFRGAMRATVTLHPIRRMPADACTEQLGVPGPWFERVPHFRMDHTPSSGAEIQSEYFIPRELTGEALLALDRIKERFRSLIQVSEVRTIAADELWMSPAYGRESTALHFTWVPDGPAVREVLPAIEDAIAPFEPRPHWGKVFTMASELVRSRYPRLPAFVELLSRHDPDGKFRNSFLERYVFRAR